MGNASGGSVALTLPLGPSTTLESVYAAVATEFGLGACPYDMTYEYVPPPPVHPPFTPTHPTGALSFAICCNATGAPLGLGDLHAGTDRVAYVDPKRPRPPQATAEGAETLPIPPGPKPRLLSKNFDHAMRPSVGMAHLRVGFRMRGGRIWLG